MFSDSMVVSAEIRCALTRVAYGCMFMTDAARQRDPEKRAPQSRRATCCCNVDQLSAAVEQLSPGLLHFATSSLSYLEQAQRLKQPVPPTRSQTGIHRQTPGTAWSGVSARLLRPRVSISEVVSRALLALLPRGRGRWVTKPSRPRACSWNIDSIVYCRTSLRTCTNLLVPR